MFGAGLKLLRGAGTSGIPEPVPDSSKISCGIQGCGAGAETSLGARTEAVNEIISSSTSLDQTVILNGYSDSEGLQKMVTIYKRGNYENLLFGAW